MRTERERHFRHSARASRDVAFPSTSHSFRSVRVHRVSSDDQIIQAHMRSASCRVKPGASRRVRRHHSSATASEHLRLSRRHTLQTPPISRGSSTRSRSVEADMPPGPLEELEIETPGEGAGKEPRRRRLVIAIGASFLTLAVVSILIMVVVLTQGSKQPGVYNQTAKYYTFIVSPHHPLSEPLFMLPYRHSFLLCMRMLHEHKVLRTFRLPRSIRF